MQKKSAVHHFIDTERAKGTSDKDIRHQLLDTGWQMDIIQHAMAKKSSKTPQVSSKPQQSLQDRATTVVRQPVSIVVLFVILVLIALFI